MKKDLQSFFTPKGVAVIGASSNPGKLSHGILKNLIQYGYQGGIYPVNPGSKEILSLACYAGIQDVPDPVELAVIILPSQMIASVIKDCGLRGIKAAIIISGGFREVGEGGLELEKECLKIASEHGIHLIGPNCVGNMNMSNGLNTTFIQGMPIKGGIGFLSQSGAVCGGIVDHILNKQIGFSHFISLGNEADVNETDIIEFLAEDGNTHVIAAYVESIRDGQRFIQVCRKVSPKKPIVILKAGRSEAGAKAVSSHTGSLAGSQEAYSAAFKQAGAIEVFSVEELLNVSLALDYLPLPSGNRAAIITNAGGPAALASDSLSEYGFQLAQLNEKTRQTLSQNLSPAAQVSNPVDMLGGAEAREYGLALHQVLNDPEVDIAIPILVPQALVKPEEVAQAIANEVLRSKKPVIACFMGLESIGKARIILHQNRVPLLDYPEKIGKVVGSLIQYSQIKKTRKEEKKLQIDDKSRQKVTKIFTDNKNKVIYGEVDTRPILQEYGIPLITGDMARTRQEAGEIAHKIGFPVVLKIVSQDFLHKSEVEGIAVNLKSKVEVSKAWDEIMKKAKFSNPKAKVDGCWVEAMAKPGQEVILGIKRDASFGPVMMFGLGGIFVEFFKDVAFRVAPITRGDAFEMVSETRAGVLLQGYRGQPETDIVAIVDCLLRLSQLAMDFTQIAEMEINPLMVYPKNKGVLALDCRLLLHKKSA
jgi:acetyl coenzyme A synthetase (ADP forming)-like protein